MRAVLLMITFLLAGCRTYYSPSGKAFPWEWGKPPEIQTKDYRLLPYNYGYGSSTLYHWILENTSNQSKNPKDLGPPHIKFEPLKPIPLIK